MADTIRFREFAPRPAAWPSGKAEDCKSFTPSSNLGAAFDFSSPQKFTGGVLRGCPARLDTAYGVPNSVSDHDFEPAQAEGERKVSER